MQPNYPFPNYVPCKGPEDTTSTEEVRNTLVRGRHVSLKISVDVLFYRPCMTIEDAIIEMTSLISMGMIGSRIAESKQHLTTKDNVGTSAFKGSRYVQAIRLPWPT